MATKSVRSIEEQVEDLAKKQLVGVKYYTKTETINSEIEAALKAAPSKSGGSGSNYPDIKLLLETKTMRRIPVMIEVKGKKGDFIRLTADGEIDNKKKDGTENFTNINKYAVNGAVHYANAIVEHTASYKEVVAIGINGYYDEGGALITEIGVYYISLDNFCIPKPIYHALNTSDMELLFDTLGIKRYPITQKSEKNKWKVIREQLCEARSKKAIDVLEVINQSKLIPMPPKLEGWYRLYKKAPETIYASNTSIQSLLDLDYSQFIAAIDFLYPEALFSTEHGVKGEEYDNVIFVISKGWNQYQFETYAPMITGHSAIPNGKQMSFERNRNLFYVCCSRPRKRLVLFVTVPIDSTFRSFLKSLVGEENIVTYSQYIDSQNDNDINF